jgi:hypothetical protein
MMSRQFSKEIERAAFFRCNGHCACGAKLTSGNIHYDHIVPWALSFDSSPANCQVLCNSCHRDKTANRDVPSIAKAKRQADFHQGITGPGFSRLPMPAGRLSRLKKTFRHGVVPRTTQVEEYRRLMRELFPGWQP